MKYKIIKEIMTDDILLQIMDIDKKLYKENYTLDWYKERYNENNIAFCLYNHDKMIGYIVIAGIKESLYNDIKAGKCTNDYEFDPKLFDYNSKYMYLASINILEEYRGKHLGFKLAKTALKNYKGKNIIAITVSEGGRALTFKGLDYIKKHFIKFMGINIIKIIDDDKLILEINT